MIDTKELEMKILACIYLKNEILTKIDLQEKYFTNYGKILTYFKDLYNRYKYLDVDLITNKKENNINLKALNFMMELAQVEPTPSAITGYYKRLKEVYRDNKITETTVLYKKKEIDYKEFNKRMFYINKEDNFDEEEMLTLDKIDENETPEREYTNIAELDYLLKGIEYGKLSLWSGITNHGKTTLMIQFAKECIKKKKKIFYFSGEQTAKEFKNYLYVGMCTKEQLDFIPDKVNPKIYDVKPKREVKEWLDNIYKEYVFLYNNNIPQNTLEVMMKIMQKAFNNGIRIFFIDNFMQLDNSEKLEEQTKIVESFKRFARDNNCIINLVAHPRKTQFLKNRLTIFDIAGTQNIANKSANICSIIRTDLLSENEKNEIRPILANNGYDIDKCSGIVEVIKTKGNNCKMVGLIYDQEKKTYKEAPKVLDQTKRGR